MCFAERTLRLRVSPPLELIDRDSTTSSTIGFTERVPKVWLDERNQLAWISLDERGEVVNTANNVLFGHLIGYRLCGRLEKGRSLFLENVNSHNVVNLTGNVTRIES